MEIYKVISDYPTYEVSNMGNVRNIKTGRVLKPGKDKSGYLMVWLWNENGKKVFKVHRLVANAFIPNPEIKPCVNHIDGCKSNNYVSNLEWCTSGENQSHAYRIGLKFHSDKAGSPKQRVRCIETGQEFESQLDAGKYFGCHPASIWQSIHKGHRVLKQFHFELV